MSDDIVERLRLGTQDPHNGYYQDMADAADEIERLRAANEDLDAACSLRLTEIERLREYVEWLMANVPVVVNDGFSSKVIMPIENNGMYGDVIYEFKEVRWHGPPPQPEDDVV